MLSACSATETPLVDEAKTEDSVAIAADSLSTDTIIAEETPDSTGMIMEVPRDTIGQLEQTMIDSGLVCITDLDSSIVIDLKYSTTDNFLHADVYGVLNRAYLQPEVAEKLVLAQAALKKKDSTLSLIIYDACRPRSVQRKMWDMVELPPNEKGKFVSNPNRGSLHNFGAAVDVSIVDASGEALDMGTPFDYIGELAYPKLEQALLDSGLITQEVIDNRKLLRSVMRRGGFWGIQTEWWHFNSCRRDTAAKYYPLIE